MAKMYQIKKGLARNAVITLSQIQADNQIPSKKRDSCGENRMLLYP